jgi:hypothetical protein
MGPSFAESATSLRLLAWLIGTLCAFVIVLVALRPEPARHVPMTKLDQFEQYTPVKKCVDGRWVIAHQRQ